MTTTVLDRETTGYVVLDIGGNTGALIVYTSAALLGREIEVSPISNAARRTHTVVRERRVAGRSVYAGVFAELVAGEYSLWRDVVTDQPVSLEAGSVAEVDWRDVVDADSFRVAMPDSHTGLALRPVPIGCLPARYRGNRQANPAPMAASPLCYGPAGEIAWDQMWTSFCDLALAGGPKHRPTLLEPPTAAEIAAEPDAHARVVREIERGLRLVTGRQTPASPSPGWVGLACDDEPMARWLVSAIAEENVSVHRIASTIYVPAGPRFRTEVEIKNVVTVVAKTHHYWVEHLTD